jgi:hypothetical protein
MSEMMAPVEGEQIVDALASTEAGKPDASGAMELVKYDAACRALAEARSADEVKHVRDIAMAIRLCAKQAKNKDLEADAFELRSRAEKRLGDMIKAQKETIGLNKGTAGQGRPALGGSSDEPPKKDDRPTLAEAGIPKSLSSKAQKLSNIPLVKFEQMIEEGRAEIQRPAEKRLLKEVDVAEKRAAYKARGQRVGQSTPRQPKGILGWADAWGKAPLKQRQKFIEKIGLPAIITAATEEQRAILSPAVSDVSKEAAPAIVPPVGVKSPDEILALVRRLRVQERRSEFLDVFDWIEAHALSMVKVAPVAQGNHATATN